MEPHSLRDVLAWIKGGGGCSLCPLSGERSWRLVLIEPDLPEGVRAVVVSESPRGRMSEVEVMTCAANVPIFPYIYTVMGGLFRPVEGANSYWTHVCKCYSKDVEASVRRRALEACSRAYLKHEIGAVKPKLVIAVGEAALLYFAKETRLKLLRGSLAEVFRRQGRDGIYREIRLGSVSFSLAILPHPSGRSRFWNNMTKEDAAAFKRISNEVKAALNGLNP